MHNHSEILANVVRTTREEKNMTQSQLAEKAGVGQRTILEIENNRGNPRFHILVAIVQALGIPSDTIFHPRPLRFEEAMKRFALELDGCSEKEKGVILDSALYLARNIRSIRESDDLL